MKRNLIKYGLGLSSLFLLNSSLLMAEDNVTSIDALVVYSQGAADEYNGDAETRIDHLFTTTNKIYEDSGLNVELNPVKMQLVDLDDSATSGQILGETRQDAEIKTLRDSVGADEVVIYRPYANDGLCGLAYVNNGSQAYAYAHVTIDCGGYVTGHEVGHNMHLSHSAKQDPNAGYARGHGVQDQFVTVMAYSQAYNGEKIYKFSDPDLDCNGEPCGIEAGLDNEADAVKEILIQAPVIANFREHIVVNDKNNTDDNNKPDNNNTDNNNTNTTDLDAAKKAYDDQVLVVNDAKKELQTLRENVRTVRTTARTEYKTKVQELTTAFKATKLSEKEALKGELDKLRQQYLVARSERKAKNITKSQFKAIVAEIRTQRNTLRTTYKESIATKKTDLKAKIQVLKEAKKAKITEAKASLTTFKTDVYLVAVSKLKELRKIYNDLLNAN